MLPLSFENCDHSLSIDDIVEPRLAAVFHDIQHLAALINHHVANSTQMNGDVFQMSVSSIQSRLLRLKDVAGSPLTNGLCLGMLAFLTTMFYVPGSESITGYLAEQLRDSCQRLVPSTPKLQTTVFWLLMLSRISIFAADEPWLKIKMLETVKPGLSWTEARHRLKNVVWIDCIHDESGRKAFHALTG